MARGTLDRPMARIAALEQEDVQARRWAALTLGRFGSSAAEAAPALINELADRDRWVRTDALRTLGNSVRRRRT